MTPELQSWNELSEQIFWDGLLLGNGASINVWPEFRYGSLYTVATTELIDNGLSNQETRIFDEFNSANFEQVLGALVIARDVNNSFGIENAELDAAYERIKNALVAAVHHVHVPWNSIRQEALVAIRNALRVFNVVFSLNYDLIVYWAMMAEGPDNAFKDHLWGRQFDITDTEVWGKSTRVLWPHGGLHLYRGPWGDTHKRAAQGPGSNLLQLFGSEFDGKVPLFVSEGSYRDKMSSIMRSDYLSFCYHELAGYGGPLVIFGWEPGNEDKHITEAIRRKGRSIAVSILPGDEQEVVKKKSFVNSQLAGSDLHFFDATTHPLGDSSLRVDG